MLMTSFAMDDSLRHRPTAVAAAAPSPPPATPAVRPVAVRMKDLPGSVLLELSPATSSVRDLIARFHEHAFAKTYAAFASRASLLAMRSTGDDGPTLCEVALTSLDDVRDREVLVYKPCDELRALVEQGCITPVLAQRAAASAVPSHAPSTSPSGSSMKRKGRAASVAHSSERVHRYAPLLESMNVSPRERAQITNHLLRGDAQVADALEQFSLHRNAESVRRALRGPAGNKSTHSTPTSSATPATTVSDSPVAAAVSVDRLMDNFMSLEMQSPAGVHVFDLPSHHHPQNYSNPFVLAASAAAPSPVELLAPPPPPPMARPSMMMMMMMDDDHMMADAAPVPAPTTTPATEVNPFLVHPPIPVNSSTTPSSASSTPTHRPPRSRTPKKHHHQTPQRSPLAARPSLLFDDSALTANAPSVFLHSIKEKATPPATSAACSSSRLSLSLDDLDGVVNFDELRPQLFSVAALLDGVPVGRDFADRYDVGRVLGSGKYSVVKLATRRADQHAFAVKIIDKRQMLEVRFLKRELEIMFALRHDGVVQLLELFESNDELFLVMELCSQELFEYVDRNGPLEEPAAQRLIKRLVETVAYLHGQCVVHRDIKPENILIRGRDVWDIKLTDFGIARKLEGAAQLLTPHESLEVASLHEPGSSSSSSAANVVQNRVARAHTKCGTRDYVAPEVMSGKGYGTEADLWSVGVVTYVLLSGCAPVFLPGPDGTKKVFFTEDCWHELSDGVKSFIEALLVRNPEERSTAVEALRHPWLQGV